MKLQVKCSHCKEEFFLEKTYLSRPDLIHEIGEYFRLPCSHCNRPSEYHANDVKAIDSFSGNVFGSLLGIAIIVITTLAFWNMGFITNIGFIIT